MNIENREIGIETNQEKIEREVREVREEFSRPVSEECEKVAEYGPRIGFPGESFVERHIKEEAFLGLKKYIEGRDVVDCGSGDSVGTFLMAKIAKTNDAKRYVPIDISYPPFSDYVEDQVLEEAERQNGSWGPGLVAPGEHEGMPVIVVRDEMLLALAKMKEGNPKFFIFAGVNSGEAKKYTEHLAAEIERLCQKGDAVLHIEASDDLKVLIEKGFKKEGVAGVGGRFYVKE